ncbi:integrase core domain-containing protein [Tenacibaculum sp. MAR_2009_124]|uniref:integrase core domain-containing protein n=1 Tax=Tenacibaculum sp. MAR_2009_124 TaxID=1250059 RepID=UPI000A6A9908|nr:integrase core domain-containing protein [Tenacibaculum sp. MAR_2009_124]
MTQNKIKTSITEKHDPYENAIAERVNGILKQEFNIALKVDSLDVKTKLIKEAIDLCNYMRPHLSNHMLTPKKMHQQRLLKPKRYKTKILREARISEN